MVWDRDVSAPGTYILGAAARCETIRWVRLGLHALGIGAGAQRAVIDAVAVAAEEHGFATLWSGEHVVLVDRPASRYPYSADGRIAVPSTADWMDPLIGLSFAAAATTTIGLATGVLLLPEHNPVVVAKQAATLDRLSGGRLTLGAGIGWSREEFETLGVPFERRAPRTAEYVAAMRRLWRDDVASFAGEFIDFQPCASIPNRHVSVVSRLWWVATAMRRCAGWWIGATAGTASTFPLSPLSPLSPTVSRSLRGCAAAPAGTLASFSLPSPSSTSAKPTSRP